MNSPFSQYCVLTTLGEQKINAHLVAGTKLALTHLVLGDGNGDVVTPDKNANALVREFGREPITETDPAVVSGGIYMSPAMAQGYEGKWLREAGLVDSDGDLIVWGPYSPTLISPLTERNIMIKMPVVSSDTVEIRVDPMRKFVTQTELNATNSTIQELGREHQALALKVTENTQAIEALQSQSGWHLVRAVPYADISTSRGVLLGTIRDLLLKGFKIEATNADGECVFLPNIHTVGIEEATPYNGVLWRNFWVRADDGAHPIKNSTISSDCETRMKSGSYLLANSPRTPMTLFFTHNKARPSYGQYPSAHSWGDGHSEFDLAAAGFSKSDNLYLFFNASDSYMQQPPSHIHIYIGDA